MPSFRSFNYVQTYTEVLNTDCDDRLPADFPSADLQAKLCSACTSPACLSSKYVQSLDGADSPALCELDLSELQSLCTSLEACHSVSWHTSIHSAFGPRSDIDIAHGYLNGFGCGAHADPAIRVRTEPEPHTNMYIKQVGEKDTINTTCPLGVGAEVVGGHYPEVEGLYEFVSPMVYQSMDTLSKVEFHSSGCGWVVSKGYQETTAPTPTPAGCADDNEGANALFGFMAGSPDYLDNICDLASSAWGAGSYCAHDSFAMECVVACSHRGFCSRRLQAVDMDDAVVALAQLGGPAAASCAETDCADRQAARFCPETCTRTPEKFSDFPEMTPVEKLRAQTFRARMRDAKLSYKHGARARVNAESQRRKRRLSAEARALGWETGLLYEEIYYTFDGTDMAGCTQITMTRESMNSMQLYDVALFHAPLPISMVHSCPAADSWNTTEDRYCRRKNVAARYNTNPEIVENGCYVKCGPEGRNATYDTIADGHHNDWCSGNSFDFTQETNALCLPREDCERLCREMDGQDGRELCVSFDMHRYLPQCYLNNDEACSDEANQFDDVHWDIIYKASTPDKVDAKHDNLRDTFTTYTGRNCTGFDAASQTAMSRESCEKACALDRSCIGFLYFATICDVGSANDPAVDCPAAAQGCTLMDDSYFASNPALSCSLMDAHFGLGGMDGRVDLVGDYVGTNLGSYATVLKNVHQACYVDVDAHGDYSPFHGRYFKRADPNNVGTYLKADNTSKLLYEVSAGGVPCDSWYLESNAANNTEETWRNCTDVPAQATVFLSMYYAENYTAVKDNMKHPCQWGYDEGICEDAVFHGLCAHTCTQFESVTVSGDAVRWQKNSTTFGLANSAPSTCNGDNNWAAWAWLNDYFMGRVNGAADSSVSTPTGADVACAAIASGDYTTYQAWTNNKRNFSYEYTIEPCTNQDYSGILAALCKVSCPDYPNLPDPSRYYPPDETNSSGAIYSYNARRLNGYTTSGSGAMSNEYTTSYLNGDSAEWNREYKSWVNGSHDANSPYAGAVLAFDQASGYVVTAGEACPTGNAIDSESMYIQLDAAQMYRMDMPVDDSVALGYVCRDKAACPPLTTCILSPIRFDDDLTALFGVAGDIGGLVKDATNLDNILDFELNAPRVYITDYRATGIYTAEKFELTPTIFRDVPAATRVTLTSMGAAAKATISMVSPRLAAGYYAQEELGRQYVVPAGYEEWQSDVLRVEAFDANSDPVAADLAVTLHIGAVGSAVSASTLAAHNGDHVAAANSLLRVFAVDQATGDLVLTDAAAPVAGHDGVFALTLAAGTDYVATLDVDECVDESLCDEHATCTNGIGGAHTCACNANYIGSGAPGDCMLDPASYDVGTMEAAQHYYITIKHGDVLQLGWRIQEIELYDNAQCSGNKLNFRTGTKQVKANFPAEASTTYEQITKESQVYTGEIGYSHYPHPTDKTGNNDYKYWNANLFDGSTNNEWRSECLNCSPDAPATIEFLIEVSTRIDCIKVKQDSNYASKQLIVERGPAGFAGGKCGPYGNCGDEKCPPCEASMTWTQAVAGGANDQVMMTCGTPNTQIFGEISMVVGHGWEGSYPNDHPVQSPCHCHQLCVEHLHQGCRSYKYYEETNGIRHCYLQSSIFESGQGFYGVAKAEWPFWTSGTPALRYIKNEKQFDKPWLLSVSTEPAYAPGASLDVTLSGIGLPYSTSKAVDASDLQRIKVVREDQDCREKLPEEVNGISCVESNRNIELLAGTVSSKIYTFCGPRPSSANADEVTFSGIQISATTQDTSYKVCYCAFDCFEPTRWQTAPGTIDVPGSQFTWSSEPAEVYRKSETDALSITVTRPLFGSHSDNEHWELKLVRYWFDCTVDMTNSLFGAVNLTASSCWGPDACTWDYTLNVDLDNTGDYLICFRAASSDEWTHLPSSGGDKYLAVLQLAADQTHPRGIFHNQYFSALAGASAALPVQVKGTRLAIPASGRITLSTSSTCGDLEEFGFEGAVVAQPTGDTAAPTLVTAECSPAGGSNVQPSQRVALAFSEPVMIGDDCAGAFTFFPTAGSGTKISIACDNADIIVLDNKVILYPEFTEGTTYYVAVESGAVSDHAGNSITLVVTDTTYSFSAIAGSDDTAPEVLYTTPDQGRKIAKGNVTHHSGDPTSQPTKVSLIFSEDITELDGTLTLKSCGPDFVCGTDDDVTIETYVADTAATDTAVVVSGATMTVSLGLAVSDYTRYTLVIPAAVVNDAAAAALAADYEFEFVLDSSAFDVSNSIQLDTALSNDEVFTFQVQLSAETPSGKYSVCFCNEQEDLTLESLGDGASTYKLTEDSKCNATASLTPGSEMVMGYSLVEHVCETKCSKGCIGPHCFCDGYTDTSTATMLCLPKEQCAEACNAATGCVGINVHDDLSQCELISNTNHCTDTDEEWQFFAATAGTACTSFSDFTEKAGSLFVTQRVEVGVDYIFTPNAPGSIELTGPETANFTYESGYGGALSKDRITVIDCGGTCGVSSPTSSMSAPANSGSIDTWNQFWPMTHFRDSPHEDADNIPFASPYHGELVTDKAEPANDYYGVHTCEELYDGKFCPESNLQLSAQEPVAFDGLPRAVSEHQCYNKCGPGAKEVCTADYCYCDGYFSGYDSPSSNALCADQALCQYICDQLEDCKSIDMHKTLNRCFLNDGTCSFQMDALMSDESYKLLIKQNDPNDYPPPSLDQSCLDDMRRLKAAAAPRKLDTLIERKDLGFSWEKMLRFTDLTFSSGGTFKLCFCDSSQFAAGSGGVCSSAADYNVEVGTIHSSGVSCLIAKPELQRVACTEQYHHGNLRCYSYLDAAPTPQTPLYAARTEATLAGAVNANQAGANGLLQPNEDGGQVQG